MRNSFAAGAGPTSGVAAGFAAHLPRYAVQLGPARPSRRVGLPLRKGEVELPQHGVDVLDGRVEVRSQRAARQHHLDMGGRWFGSWLPRGLGHWVSARAIFTRGTWAHAYARPQRALPDSKISRLISGCTCTIDCGLGGVKLGPSCLDARERGTISRAQRTTR